MKTIKELLEERLPFALNMNQIQYSLLISEESGIITVSYQDILVNYKGSKIDVVAEMVSLLYESLYMPERNRKVLIKEQFCFVSDWDEEFLLQFSVSDGTVVSIIQGIVSHILSEIRKLSN